MSSPRKEDGNGLLDGYLTRAELAAALSVSPKTIARYEDQPDGLLSIVIGGRKLYRLEAVRGWLTRREHR